MHGITKERAYELMERDLTVYMIQQGENPEMAFDTALSLIHIYIRHHLPLR